MHRSDSSNLNSMHAADHTDLPNVTAVLRPRRLHQHNPHVCLLTWREGGLSLTTVTWNTALNSLHICWFMEHSSHFCKIYSLLKSVMVVNHWVSTLKYCGSQPSPQKTAEILLFACTLTHIFFISKQEISHRVGSQGVISDDNTKQTHYVCFILSILSTAENLSMK